MKYMYIHNANGERVVAKKKGVLHGICQGKNLSIEALIVAGYLLSVSQLINKGNNVCFNRNNAKIEGYNFEFKCKKLNNLFVLNVDFETETEYCNKTVDSDLWHRLGHLNRHGLKLLGLPRSQEKCSECIEGKSSRTPFHQSIKQSKQIGDLIHSDVAGPINPPTSEGYRYFQVLIDDFSHFVVVKLLKTKGEAAENVIDFTKQIKTQHGLKT